MASAILMESDGFEFVVEHDNWEAFRLFLSCATQWRLKPMGGLQGIDYPSLESIMRMQGVKNRPERFNQVRLIERGALARFNGVSLGDLYG